MKNIVLSYSQKADVLMLEAYHKAQLEKMMPSDEELENIHQFNGAKWLKQKLLKE